MKRNRSHITFDREAGKYTASMFRDGNFVYGSGYTKKQAAMNLRDELRRRRRAENPTMSKKKKAKKKKRNSRPRKGVIPPGLRKYMEKMRAKKQNSRRRKKAKRNSRSRPFIGPGGKVWHSGKRKKKGRPLKQAKAILLSELRKAGYAIAPKPNRRRRTKPNKRRNPPRSIRIPGTVTAKQRRAIGRFLARTTGRRIVYKKAGRR